MSFWNHVGAEDPYSNVCHKTAVARRLRDIEWKNTAAWEGDVIKPYLAVYNAPPQEWLRIIALRSEVIMKTNTDLQQQVASQATVVKGMQKEFEMKKEAWEQAQTKLREDKDRQAAAQIQLRELHEAHVKEEGALRDQTVALRDKTRTLMEQKRRLEAQKRNDERRVSKNCEMLEELRFMQAKLELRKATLDNDNHDMNYAIGTEPGGTESEVGEPSPQQEEAPYIVGSTLRGREIAEPDPDRSQGPKRSSTDGQNFVRASFSDSGPLPEGFPVGRRPSSQVERSRGSVDMFHDDFHDDLNLLQLPQGAAPSPQRSSPSRSSLTSAPPLLPKETSAPGARTTMAGDRDVQRQRERDEACNMCGQSLAPDAVLCRKCGTKKNQLVCLCGSILMPDASFCRKCGRTCEKEEVEAFQAGAAQPVAPATPKGSQNRPAVVKRSHTPWQGERRMSDECDRALSVARGSL